MLCYISGTISQGQYEFQFDITLPDVLPSSYKNEFGSIRYFLFGIYNELQACQKTKEEFTLINIIDLNALPLDMFEPTSYQSERELSFCCCGNGILSMEMFLGKKAFTTGEVATVKIKLKNTSTARSKGLKLELVEKVTACVPERSPRSRIYRKVLSRAGCLINFPRGENVFNLPLMIPENFAVLKFDGSTLWKVEYLVVATCLLSSWHTDVVVNSEVTIGQIETRRRTESPPSYTERDSAPPPYSTLPRNPEDRIMIAETNM
nr:unnamed protein product [Callosobruchus chinensis]